jgi:hypothetical protein
MTRFLYGNEAFESIKEGILDQLQDHNHFKKDPKS